MLLSEARRQKVKWEKERHDFMTKSVKELWEEGKRTQQIAKEMNLPESSVRNILRR